jgi:hypothetical protein
VDRARESIKQDSISCIRLGQSIGYELKDNFIRYKLATVHEALRQVAQLCAILQVVTKYVSSGDMGNGQRT